MTDNGTTNGRTELQREADMQQSIGSIFGCSLMLDRNWTFFTEYIDATQSALEGLNDQASEEILKIESKYNKQREPLYKRRSELFSRIPVILDHAYLNLNS